MVTLAPLLAVVITLFGKRFLHFLHFILHWLTSDAIVKIGNIHLWFPTSHGGGDEARDYHGSNDVKSLCICERFNAMSSYFWLHLPWLIFIPYLVYFRSCCPSQYLQLLQNRNFRWHKTVCIGERRNHLLNLKRRKIWRIAKKTWEATEWRYREIAL